MALRRVLQQPLLRCVSQIESPSTIRHFSLTVCKNDNDNNYKLVVVGGGSGGCSTAAKFCRELGGKGQVAVIEPSEKHSYQPMWTLVGAGLKTLDQSQRDMGTILPPGCKWIKDSVVEFDPQNNTVSTASGKKIKYEYLVVAAGLQLHYEKVKGLVEALRSDPRVVSNYHPQYVTRTFPALQSVQRGNAIFTFPNTPIKCAGAPQKIMYLAEEIFRNRGVRDKVNVIYNTSLPVIFGVKKYANSLQKIVNERGITVNYRHNLVEVRPDSSEAVFQLLDSPDGDTVTFKYDFLHATPPMSAPDVVRSSPLVTPEGWVDVNKLTLQHNVYPNVFGIGDCTSLPTSKTAAAVAAQVGVLKDNLCAVMKGEEQSRKYDGYTSCPLITGKNRCILAEFDYDAEPLETFPFDQGKERRTMYIMKATFMPKIYWEAMMKGLWKGPALFRKMLHLGMGR
ncbi:sulfide:quinone oxidoreductase, mitochondrial-like isoform X2 [Babylonia areolata]|uniref:sulfide:quinone oxidoreductase, mitochondrial-like isoform X1 n=1 Tax=Babylonia areolata TaxID=304850 RepID=UPI003FD6725B